MDSHKIFEVSSDSEFDALALEIFHYQYQSNNVYREFCEHIGRPDTSVEHPSQIPFLPISLFKSRQVISGTRRAERIFASSGTTGAHVSEHHITDLSFYRESFERAFACFYGPVADYCILALLPSYLTREGSSLIYMVSQLIDRSGHPSSGFYLDDLEKLRGHLLQADREGTKVILIGVSFALLDLAERYKFNLKNTIIMETGGMKGRRQEMIRMHLHRELKHAFGVKEIHSEYGMTEMLSQAYSNGNGFFRTPPWLRVIIRDAEDPFAICREGKAGGINVMDLANLNSCSFIATQDLGRLRSDGIFEVIGRFDHSDIRGCNLMVL